MFPTVFVKKASICVYQFLTNGKQIRNNSLSISKSVKISSHNNFFCLFIPFFRTSELIALAALSTTLFLFLHTRDLNSKLREMEVKLQPDYGILNNNIGGNIIDICYFSY